eukprot:45383-Chlamydomonas_euryale.AAC.4
MQAVTGRLWQGRAQRAPTQSAIPNPPYPFPSRTPSARIESVSERPATVIRGASLSTLLATFLPNSSSSHPDRPRRLLLRVCGRVRRRSRRPHRRTSKGRGVSAARRTRRPARSCQLTPPCCPPVTVPSPGAPPRSHAPSLRGR